jgi:PqqD family protein of HPr-rel-A system
LPHGVSLAWREWDLEEVVVYNRGSGATHLLDAFSAAALRLIAERPHSAHELAHELTVQSGAAEQVVRARLFEVLETLRHLGLAEPAPPCDWAN